MIKCAPKIAKSKYNLYILQISITLYYFILIYRSFAEDRSLTEYGESLRKVESQNRLSSSR